MLLSEGLLVKEKNEKGDTNQGKTDSKLKEDDSREVDQPRVHEDGGKESPPLQGNPRRKASHAADKLQYFIQRTLSAISGSIVVVRAGNLGGEVSNPTKPKQGYFSFFLFMLFLQTEGNPY